MIASGTLDEYINYCGIFHIFLIKAYFKYNLKERAYKNIYEESYARLCKRWVSYMIMHIFMKGLIYFANI